MKWKSRMMKRRGGGRWQGVMALLLLLLLKMERRRRIFLDPTITTQARCFLTVNNSCFRGERGNIFNINHYACEVSYDASCFLEKNRDLLHMDSIQLLARCTHEFPKIFSSKILSMSEKILNLSYRRSSGPDSPKCSVATKFKIGILENTRNRTLDGILRTQSWFRGHKARNYITRYKHGVVIVQTYIHSEKIRKSFLILLHQRRAAILIQKHQKRRIATNSFINILRASVAVQSAIRGFLVRKYSPDASLWKKNDNSDQILVKASVIGELQRRVLKGESGLKEKEEENSVLHQRVLRYESRWLGYEGKMRSMEQVWQKQMRSLQCSLSVAKKRLSIDGDNTGYNIGERKSDASVEQTWCHQPAALSPSMLVFKLVLKL
ncbi:hypothetical protein ZOSMA_157G00250 [Zostera marina]|uniref:Myosin motor domain-containing protein n=1 Tax=Zostera marina TaxID=29655 RepID=A0A0K9PXH8_ZOSMR|nr:hypothetical protein ZOSMA_157G00250 [Zostera marina]